MFPKPQRPVGITLLAIQCIWNGGFGILLTPFWVLAGGSIASALHENQNFSHLASVSLTTTFVLLIFALYGGYAWIGYGLWKLKRWSWKSLVIIHWISIGIAFVIVSVMAWYQPLMALGTGVWCVGIIGAILWYLYRPGVRWPFEATYAVSRDRAVPPQPEPSKTPLWKKVTVGVGVSTAVFVTFGVCLFVSVDKSFRSSEVYKIALADANASPCVVAKVGQSIIGKKIIEGSISEGRDHGDANIVISIHGSRSNATMTLVAHKNDGTWQFTTLIVDPYDGAPIQLLPKPTPCEQS